MYFVYVIRSEKISRFYVGITDDLDRRWNEHNRSKNNYTKRGIPWVLIKYFKCCTRSEAMMLENKIKKRGIKGFIKENSIR